MFANVIEFAQTLYQGRMAEWSKALVLGTSHFGGAGSNPVPVIIRLVIYIQHHHSCHLIAVT